MIISADEVWILATCTACAVACAIPGVFLMLRRETLTGDAISHAILPGLAATFLLTGSRSLLLMMLGAACAGLMAMSAWVALQRSTHIKTDAALGMTYTSFFAVGVLLISLFARNIDLDPGCILYGLIEFTPLDTTTVAGIEVPRTFLALCLVALVNTFLVVLCFKELVLSTFDPVLARSMGFSTKAIQNGLVLITTLTIVAAFEAVGSILVVAFLAIPPATAHLLTNRVAPTILTAVAAGAISSCIGLWGAITLNTSVAGMVSVAAGLLFFLALLFTPHNGIVVKAIRRLVLKLQITQDDILGVLYRWHETPDEQRPKRALSARDLSLALRRGFITRLALHRAMRAGHVSSDAHSDAVYLTESGLVEARALVRSHRLWEAYLSKHLGLPADHLHEPSERAEHFIGRALARELQRDISTNKDPHGKKIP